jgi:signal transduction histidine kinase
MAILFNRLWPKSLYGRLAFVWLAALILGHVVQNVYGYLSVYKDQVGRTDYYLAKDLTILLPQLEGAASGERLSWLKQMARQAYYYEIGKESLQPQQTINKDTRGVATLAHLKQELGNKYQLQLVSRQSPGEDFRIGLYLQDGTLLTVIVNKTIWPVNWAMGVLFFCQILFVVSFTWLAVRQATRPLSRLAEAAETLGTALDCKPIPENGPSEVARAAVAFNRMQTQIKNHLAERVHILASISHDLQTPITRMRLRAELMDDEEQQRKWLADLKSMQILVEEGITYARTAQKTTEAICRVDVDALLDSLVCDYLDAGQQISVQGSIGKILFTRPHALRRIITNLLDNALKFATDVKVDISQPAPGSVVIAVLDRGPGIPEHELETVLQPFYRIENSRNRETGGTGLGLAIAQQLAHGLDGSISLHNREGGGLEARLVFSERPLV